MAAFTTEAALDAALRTLPEARTEGDLGLLEAWLSSANMSSSRAMNWSALCRCLLLEDGEREPENFVTTQGDTTESMLIIYRGACSVYRVLEEGSGSKKQSLPPRAAMVRQVYKRRRREALADGRQGPPPPPSSGSCLQRPTLRWSDVCAQRQRQQRPRSLSALPMGGLGGASGGGSGRSRAMSLSAVLCAAPSDAHLLALEAAKHPGRSARAAACLQAASRGRSTRRMLEERISAATHVQAQQRGRSARERVRGVMLGGKEAQLSATAAETPVHAEEGAHSRTMLYCHKDKGASVGPPTVLGEQALGGTFTWPSCVVADSATRLVRVDGAAYRLLVTQEASGILALLAPLPVFNRLAPDRSR